MVFVEVVIIQFQLVGQIGIGTSIYFAGRLIYDIYDESTD